MKNWNEGQRLLRLASKRHGQAAIARRCGVSKQAINNLCMRPGRRPSAALLLALAVDKASIPPGAWVKHAQSLEGLPKEEE